jgi:hypothetical protein
MINKINEIKNLQKAFKGFFTTFNIELPFGFIATTNKDNVVVNLSIRQIIDTFPFVLENIVYDIIEDITNKKQLRMYMILAHLQHSTKYIKSFLTKHFEKLAIFTYQPVATVNNLSNINKIFVYDVEKNIYKVIEFRNDYEILFNKEKIEYDFQTLLNNFPSVLFEVNDQFLDWLDEYQDISKHY